MRKNIALILTAVMLLCACASSNSTNQKAAELTPAPTIAPTAEPTVEPTATPFPEKSGYFEIYTTTVVDAFGTKVREVNEIVALNPASLADGGTAKKHTVYFFYDRGTRDTANSFFICIIDYSLPNSVVDKGRNNNFLGWPGSSITTGKQVQYKIDDGIYTVTYDDPYVLRGEDFERIYAALMDSKDVDISLKSNNLYYLFTVHGIGFSDLVSSVQ